MALERESNGESNEGFDSGFLVNDDDLLGGFRRDRRRLRSCRARVLHSSRGQGFEKRYIKGRNKFVITINKYCCREEKMVEIPSCGEGEMRACKKLTFGDGQ
ncbi:hypothetical protein NE237_011121 [Protea cynaroides]|uniref:Uncharacterized protein n=1 Tax=Protea cynaroides TaxID=273540 RepID=A0A9Q0GXB0_9MAGN|nr:hypothetical protein NE237_011121 [Protea cynaroides]